VCSGFLEEEPPSGTFPAARRRKRLSYFLGLLMRSLAGLVEPPGGARYFDSFLGFLEFWVKSDRGKRQW